MNVIINKLMPVAVIAMMGLASCSKSPVEITPEPEKAELSLVVENTIVKEGSVIPFKITTPNEVQSNMTMNLNVSDSKKLSAPQQLVLAAGSTEVSAEAIAVSPGDVTLSIENTVENATLKVPSVKITVTK